MGFSIGNLIDITPIGLISKDVFGEDLGKDTDKAIKAIGKEVRKIDKAVIKDIEDIVDETFHAMEDVGKDIVQGAKDIAEGALTATEGLITDAEGLAEIAAGLGQIVVTGGKHSEILDKGIKLGKRGLAKTLKGGGKMFSGATEATVGAATDTLIDGINISLHVAALGADSLGGAGLSDDLKSAGKFVATNPKFRTAVEVGVDIALIAATGGAAAPELAAAETAAEAGEIATEAGETAEQLSAAAKETEDTEEAASLEKEAQEAKDKADKANKLKSALEKHEDAIGDIGEPSPETAEAEETGIEDIDNKNMAQNSKKTAKDYVKKLAREGAKNDLTSKAVMLAIKAYTASLPGYDTDGGDLPDQDNTNDILWISIGIIVIIIIGILLYSVI